MAYDRWPLEGRAKATRRGVLCGAFAVLALLVAGCGGGGGGGGGGTPSNRATITGNVVDAVSGSGIPGVRVLYGDATATTGADGTFSITVDAPSTAKPLRIPTTTGYNALGQYNGVTVRLATDGIAIPELSAGQTFNVGTIRLFSVDSGPPPPPPI